ncbi:hypothetical protein ACTWQB_16395 [Piscibacillus sp. B03]|uniref:hypothetical protein n=1 Tax=Piscibacillus sp. B03 TaxID=3457430 RepID=UPI003FCD4DA4
MSFYVDRFNEHIFHKTLASCFNKVKQITEEDVELSEKAEDHIERLQYLLNLFRHKVEQIEPLATPSHLLKTWDTHLKKTQTELNTFLSNKQVNHLVTANENAEKVIIGALSLSHLSAVEDEEIIKERVSSLSRSIGGHKGQITRDLNEASEILKEVKDLKEEIETIKENKEEELKQLHDDKTTLFDNLEATIRDEYKEDITESITEVDNFIETQKNNLLEKKEKLDELFELVTNGAISGAYHKAAEDEKKLRNKWYWSTILGFIGLIGAATYIFFSGPDDITTYSVISKILITTALGAFITYSAKQASIHRYQEQVNRNIELKMKSIDPYLSIFEDEEMKEIKKDLVEPLFKEDRTIRKNTNEDEDTQLSISTILTLIEKIKKT